MTSNLERRVFAANTSSATGRTVIGYAARYNSRTFIEGGGFWEQIAPGAFSSAVNRGDDIRLLRDHNANLLLARTKSGTLRVKEDENGLQFSADLPNTQLADETLELIRRGDLTGNSFQFSVANDDWEDSVDDKGNACQLRTIRDFSKVYDVSICSFPAYESANIVGIRAIVPEAVLVEARARGAKAARVAAPRAYQPGHYKRLSDAEVAAIAECERGIKGRAIGESLYPWQRK
jgi:HK97 family phage prohead protease